MTREEFIASLKLEFQPIAQVYLPILSRWAADAGWESIRTSLYASMKSSTWYRAVRKRMTPSERDIDDRRAVRLVRAMAVRKSDLIAKERNILQQVVTLLISSLLAHL